MTLGVAVGKRILELINERDMSQYRLAKNTCLDYKTINDLLNKHSNDVKISTIFLNCGIVITFLQKNISIILHPKQFYKFRMG